jgi:Trypsin
MFDTLRLLSTTTILLVGTLTPLQPTASGVVGVFGAAQHDSEPMRNAPLARPHLIDDAFADVIVRLHGHVCTGTPITGTVYVVTAAHCVLNERGEVEQRTIVRDHIRYPAVAVLVNTDYFDHPSDELDVAVLVMAHVIPGPSARVGSALPDSGQVTLAGYQPIDNDGTLLRGPRPDDHPLPQGATGTSIDFPYRPAGCVESVQSLEVSAARVMVPCGLVQGASGGGLFTEDNGELVLVGILSTVTADLSANGIVPLAALHELLDHPESYAHGFTTGHTPRDHSRSPHVNGRVTAAQRLDPSGSPRTQAHAPELTFLDQPTPVQRDTISWAAGRFVAAGLQLPNLDIRFPVFCNGKGALYHVGQSSIDFCRVNRKNVLHELAHAWDDTSGVVDRERFMNLRDVTVWFGGLDVPAREQGSEHLAIIIAWGLMDPGTGSTHGLPNNSETELSEAFELLTESSLTAGTA